MAGTSYRAQAGDSISRIVGSNDPQAVGSFMRANNLTSDHIEVGRNYFVPLSATAYGDSDALGWYAPSQDDERSAVATQSKQRSWPSAFAAVDDVPSAEPAWSFREATMVQRKLDDALAMVEYRAGSRTAPGMSAWDQRSSEARMARDQAVLNYLDGQQSMALGAVAAAATMLTTNDIMVASATTDAVRCAGRADGRGGHKDAGHRRAQKWSAEWIASSKHCGACSLRREPLWK